MNRISREELRGLLDAEVNAKISVAVLRSK